MPPRICTSCDEPHVTTDWYIVAEHKHPRRGEVECRAAHENRIRRETAEMTRPTAPHPNHVVTT